MEKLIEKMDKYFIVSGFEGADTPFSCKVTLMEIALNVGKYKDTEMLYALKELHGDMIMEMPMGAVDYVRLNRDIPECKGVIQRVHLLTYGGFNETVE